MRALVVGAGSVGGYFGGRLAAAGRDVTFLVRPQRATQLAYGLTIVSKGQETIVPAKVITTGEAAGEFDLILLAVKAYQLDAAIEDFGAYVNRRSVILPVLNGMKHVDTLRSRFGSPRVIGGVAKIASSLDERGRILDQADFHDLAYGEWSGERSGRILAVDQFMTGAGFEARLSSDIERDMWEKWAMLASLGAITCLLDGDVGQVARAPGGIDLVKSLIGEVVAAIGAAWRALSDSFKAQVVSLLTDRGSSLTSSMYRDMKGGYRVEADQIIGDLVVRATEKGIATPLLSAVLTAATFQAQSGLSMNRRHHFRWARKGLVVLSLTKLLGIEPGLDYPPGIARGLAYVEFESTSQGAISPSVQSGNVHADRENRTPGPIGLFTPSVVDRTSTVTCERCSKCCRHDL